MDSSIIRKFKSLADPGRLHVFVLISTCEELCVCEIEQILGLTPSTASRNLRDLELAGWLTSRRAGRWIYYRLAELDPAWLEVKDSVLKTAHGDPAIEDMLRKRDELVSSGRRASCNSTPESLETFYEQLDDEQK